MDKYFKCKKKICCKDTGEICFGYANYLKSQHWALTRSRIIQNHPYCEMCKGCVFYKRNEETKKYYCERTKSRITGNSSACKHFTLGSK